MKGLSSNVSICLFFTILLFFSACRTTPKTDPPTTQFTGTIADSAMVASATSQATKVGVDILKQGGNAIDAAIGVQFALAVTYPRAGNIGGGGFMVVRTKDGKAGCLDFREKAPAKAHRDMYLDEKGDVISGMSLDGHLAVGVPGVVDGMVKAHKKYGSLKWADLVQPSVELAAKGYVLSEIEAEKLTDYQDDFKAFATTENGYFIKEGGWKGMDTLVQTDLAKTLSLIRDQGEAGFYEGATADNIVAEMERGKGFITYEDLKNYDAVWREPIIGDYKNYKIISMPPPSSGGVALLQLFEMVEQQPLKNWGFHAPQTIHRIVEAERLVYADRAAHLGDPDFYKVPVAGLLEAEYLTQRMKSIDPLKARRTSTVKAGKPKGAVESSTSTKTESEQTTHFSIVDQYGNAVSLTTTLNSRYGSRVVVGGSGFLLNNEMDDFSAKPGVPNLYGLVGTEANAIQPGKRMLSSMTPTIVEKNDNLFMVVGTPGGSTIITSVFQTILNVIEFEMGMQEAVNAYRFHHQWKPDSLYIEDEALSAETIETLTQMGHYITKRSPIGRVDAILVLPDGRLEGGADIRGEDKARGF